MVEERTINKLNNCLKHFANPILRVKNKDNDFYIDTNTTRFDLNILDDINQEKERNIIGSIINNDIFKPYRTVEVYNVDSNQSTNLDLRRVPDHFIIYGLPDRQIKLKNNNYIDLDRVTYQKLYSLILSKNQKGELPVRINFEELKKVLKRKYLILLLIILNQENDFND